MRLQNIPLEIVEKIFGLWVCRIERFVKINHRCTPSCEISGSSVLPCKRTGSLMRNRLAIVFNPRYIPPLIATSTIVYPSTVGQNGLVLIHRYELEIAIKLRMPAANTPINMRLSDQLGLLRSIGRAAPPLDSPKTINPKANNI